MATDEDRRGGAMARIAFTLFGGFQVRLKAGPPLRVPTRKAQGLLAYLALPPGLAHSRDKLTALLWGDMREGRARTNLRQTLFTLRKALPVTMRDILRLDGADLTLDPAAVDVDVGTFETLVTRGTPQALAQAAAVYQGDLLQGLGVREASFEEWLMAERDRLRELAIEALAKLLAHQRAAGATEAALQTALRLLALDPLLEIVHRTLMRLYVQLGRRETAIRQYQMCVGVLHRELGVEPEEETKRLYQDILRARLVSSLAVETSGSRRSPSRLTLHGSSTLTTATSFIGRELDVTRLREALIEADEGHGQLVVILGEAGIGKTRLVGELVSGALQADGHRVLLGRCYEGEQIVPFGPWVEAFRRAQIADDLTEPQDGPGCRTGLARLLPELDRSNTNDAATSPDHVRLFKAVAQFLGLLAARQPLVLIVEDLHWADDVSLRLLAYLGHRLQDWSMLLVVTARSDELPEAPVLNRWLDALERESPALRLTLAPLSSSETMTLVRTLAPAGTPETTLAQLGEQISRMSEGNPFVAVETMRALSPGATPSATAELRLPSCVRETITRRLDQLTTNAKLLCTIAAVIGRDFDFRLLSRVGALAEAAAAEALEELVCRQILRGQDDRFAFTHDRVRDVAYDGLLAPRRKLLHAKVAEALEALYATDLEAHYVALGLHYARGEVWPKATSYLWKAGTAAMARSAYREAATCLERALVSARHLADEHAAIMFMIDLRLDLYRALLSLGELRKLFETLREAETQAKALDDQSQLGRVWSGMSQYFQLEGDPRRAIDAGRRALAAARAVGDLGLDAETSCRLAQAHRSRGDYREAVRLLIRNVDLLEGRGVGTTPSALGESAVLSRIQLVLCYGELGQISSAIAVAEESLRFAEAMGRMDLVAGARCALGIVYLAKGEFYSAIANLEESVRLCRLRELRVWQAWAQAPLGEAYMLAGRLAAAVARLEHAVKRGAFLKHSHAMRVVNLGQAYLCNDRLSDARQTAQHALSLAREHQERGHEAWALRLLGEIESRSDPPDREAARRHYLQALAQADELGMRPLVARCHLGLGALYREAEDPPHAESHLTTASDLFREMGMPSWLVRAEQLLSRPRSSDECVVGSRAVLREPRTADALDDGFIDGL